MWLKDLNGAVFRIADINAVTPAEMKDDKRDQTKVTRVTSILHMGSGHTHHTALPFDEVLKTLASAPPAAPAGAPGQDS